MSRRVDPIRAEVVARFLLATAEEMGATLMRTAFTQHQGTRGLLDGRVRRCRQVIALAQRVPIHIGSMVGAMDEILRRYPRATFRPGDMFIANDLLQRRRHASAGHHGDLTVFVGRRIVAYVANIAHHADVGGMVRGRKRGGKSIYQEGLRIPPVYIQRAGKLNRDVF
jgi:N-methylhydantoinase B